MTLDISLNQDSMNCPSYTKRNKFLSDNLATKTMYDYIEQMKPLAWWWLEQSND
jgi:hypothetical protein